MAVTLNDKYLKGVVNADELKGMEPMVKIAHEMIENKNGIVADWHPSEATHEICAQRAVKTIKETLGIE